MPDVYPGDLTTRIKDLEKAVEELRAQSQDRQPLTEASQGWILRAMATPPSPGGDDVHIYAQGDELWVRSNIGTIPLRDRGQAAVVSAISLPSAGATYSTAEQTLLNTAVSRINSILLELKLAALMASS